jgi:hypothetical protein
LLPVASHLATAMASTDIRTRVAAVMLYQGMVGHHLAAHEVSWLIDRQIEDLGL